MAVRGPGPPEHWGDSSMCRHSDGVQEGVSPLQLSLSSAGFQIT